MKNVDNKVRVHLKVLLELLATTPESFDHKLFRAYTRGCNKIEDHLKSLDKHFSFAERLASSFDILMPCLLLCIVATLFYALILSCHLTADLTSRGEVLYDLLSCTSFISIPGIICISYLLHLQKRYENTIQLVLDVTTFMQAVKEAFPDLQKLEDMPAWIKEETLEVVKGENTLQKRKNSMTAAEWELLSVKTGRARDIVYYKIKLASQAGISNGDRRPYFAWAEAKFKQRPVAIHN